MDKIYYICAQPAVFYYAWQIDALLLSFEKNGNVDLNCVHIVSSTPRTGEPPEDYFVKVQKKWEKKGVLFEYYKDTRGHWGYISSIRPHLLKKHWQKHPWLEKENIFYHDCDIALTKPIDFESFFDKNAQKECYLSDTRSYIGPKYIESKGHGLLKDMCAAIDIDINLVKSKEEESGGAQYILRPGIDYKFWDNVYKDCEKLYTNVNMRVMEVKREAPDWHEIQIWCADMWSVLWNLWKLGYSTPIREELDFTWANQAKPQWEKNAIYHNAGVTGPNEPYFFKSMHINSNNPPTNAKIVDPGWASHYYQQLINEAYLNTTKS